MTKSTEKIVILDFSTGKVFIRPVPIALIEKDADEIVDFFEPLLGIRATDCQYMVVNGDDFLDQSPSEDERITTLESEGLTTSDAQGVVMAEDNKFCAGCGRAFIDGQSIAGDRHSTCL